MTGTETVFHHHHIELIELCRTCLWDMFLWLQWQTNIGLSFKERHKKWEQLTWSTWYDNATLDYLNIWICDAMISSKALSKAWRALFDWSGIVVKQRQPQTCHSQMQSRHSCLQAHHARARHWLASLPRTMGVIEIRHLCNKRPPALPRENTVHDNPISLRKTGDVMKTWK